jgi:RsiW-degrading membrane proteinase PrsW (M82 family)
MLSHEIGWIYIAGLPVYLFAICLPVYLLIQIGLRGIPLGSKKNVWSIFGLGLILGPITILISELAILFVSALSGLTYIVLNPTLSQKLLSFSSQFSRINSIEEAQKFLAPHLLNPWVIAAVLIFVCVIVPLVEEFLKPAGTWLAIHKNMQPIDGFVMGVLSGAGYALFETLNAAGNIGPGWGILLLGRAGTDLLHILNTGLMGWAMVSTWNLKGILKLFGVYILTMIIHGVWNGLGMLAGAVSLLESFNINKPWVGWLGGFGAVGLMILAILMFFSFWYMNQRLQSPPTEILQELK